MNTSYSPIRTAPVIESRSPKDPCGSAGQRLVVVILEVEEEAIFASRVLALAGTRYPGVLLLGVSLDPARQTELRRRLVTIAAFLREKRLPAGTGVTRGLQVLDVDVRIENGKNWIERIKTILREDDVLACYEEQSLGKQRRQLSDLLSSELGLPIYVFSGLNSSGTGRQNLLSQAASWLGSIAAIGAFFLLQARIVGSTLGGAQTVLLILTLGAEVSVIWIWNSLFT